MKPNFILLNGKIPFVFVIPPLDLEITTEQNTVSVNIIDFGEKVNFGERRADRISFSTFLPSITSHFFSLKNPLPPTAAVELLKKWKKEKKDLTFIVPELVITYKCKIERLQYSVIERTGDINISISLVEIRDQGKITDNITGLYKRG
ncbi:peptidoglycan-binding protein [Fusobacterium varium]|uniref:peptidoglycan-binding protein n=1 Tax=Fusobacterium TaxID=848 RepID=UPI0030CD7429